MGYKYSFMDNEIYGTDDINKAVSRLTTSGVSVYPTDENLINAMNEVTEGLATSGVDFNRYSCKVSVEGEEIKINPGTAFFDDGVSIVIDEEGETLPLKKGVYVYLFRDVNRNSCYPTLGESLPESGYVLLAEIDASGNVLDKRKFASSKLTPNSLAPSISFSKRIMYGPNYNGEYPVTSIDAGYSNFRYVLIRQKNYGIWGFSELIENELTEHIKFYDVSKIYFKKVGNKLYIYTLCYSSSRTIEDVEVILV